MREVILLLSALALFSCSSDDSDNTTNNDPNDPNNDNGGQSSVIKPKSYSVEESDGDSWTLNFEYTDNLITKITTDFGSTSELEYENGKLISITTNNNGSIEVEELIYDNNRLIERRSDDGQDIYKFYYDNNGRVDEVNWIAAGNDNISYYTYDSSGNVINEEDDFGTFKFTYDSQKNPFRNVVPQLDAEVWWSWYGSLINNQQEVSERLSGQTDFTLKYTYQYQYNQDGYPVSRRQINPDGALRETVTYTYY